MKKKVTISGQEIKIAIDHKSYSIFEKDIVNAISEKLFQGYDTGTILVSGLPPIIWSKFQTRIVRVFGVYFRVEYDLTVSRIKTILEKTTNIEEFKKIVENEFLIEKVFVDIIS